jgi:hypothetical protein
LKLWGVGDPKKKEKAFWLESKRQKYLRECEITDVELHWQDGALVEEVHVRQ